MIPHTQDFLVFDFFFQISFTFSKDSISFSCSSRDVETGDILQFCLRER